MDPLMMYIVMGLGGVPVGCFDMRVEALSWISEASDSEDYYILEVPHY